MTQEQLSKLAQEAQTGNAEAFGQLYDATFDTIFKFFLYRVKNQEDAKDLTSQIYLEAWQHLDRFDCDKSFQAWILGFAKFRLIDHYRKVRPSVSLEAVMETGDDTDLGVQTAESLDNEHLRAAVAQLPEPYKTVLQLRYIQELDYSEIAESMGKTENHLRVLVKRGLDKLRKILDLALENE